MPDPVEITQQATQAVSDGGPATHAGWAILGGVVLKVVEAFARLRGSPKERADAVVAEAGATATLVEAAKDVIEAQREDTQRVRVERDDCTARCESLEKSVEAIRREVATVTRKQAECERRSNQQQREIARQDRELRDARRLLNSMLGIDTPVHGITPNQVAAEVATAKHGKVSADDQETHGKR